MISARRGLVRVLRHVGIIGKELLCILREAVSAISERWVIIMRTDARIKAYTVDDILGVQSLHLCIGIQLVEVADAESQIAKENYLRILMKNSLPAMMSNTKRISEN